MQLRIPRPAIILSLVAAVLATSGFSCTLFGGNNGATQAANTPITLNYWRVFDDQDTIDPIITAYTALHKNVTINYKKFTFAEYEPELLNALAEDRGPDIFSIPSSYVDSYSAKITPMPTVIKVASLVTTGTIKKTTSAVIQQTPGYTPDQVKNMFVPAVADDVLRGEPGKEQVMGLPLALDTMVLFYNRDLLDNAGIAQPPKTWEEFKNDVQKLTIRNDQTGDILQYGAAFGTAKNVQRSSDIVAALMEQNGTQMTGTNGQVSFDRIPPDLTNSNINPAADALRFYTDFSSPTKELYTWNADQPDSFEAFSQGRVAFFFGYSYHAQMLAQSAPRLRVGVTGMPQIAIGPKQTTAANYWVEVVSKKTKNSDMAWDFVRFATSAEQVKSYLDKSVKPTALRGLIADQLKIDALNPYAQQLLSAVSWYHGHDPAGAETAFQTMISDAIAIRGGNPDEETSKLESIVGKSAQTIRASY